MNGFGIISPIFGVFFAIVGLALAVILGLFLYKDKSQEKAYTKKSLDWNEEGTSA